MKRADREYTKEEVMGLMEPLVSKWFGEKFDSLTEPQSMAIPIIHQRQNVLVSSPTGSGKTLTAFMSIINELTRYAKDGKLEDRVYCVYISPLKALANDVNRNLNTPLAEMREVAKREGMAVPDIRVAVRSGDTSQSDRQKMVRHPPHILITTPESLALILEAPKFRESLLKVEWVILDEIHDICDSKRGAFLSLTLERLQDYCQTRFVRIGLSATLAPIEAIAGFLVGADENGDVRDVTLVESDSKKVLDLRVICPTEDMTTLSSDIVNSMMYDSLKELIDEHETTLVFTNTRSGAESVVYKLKERGLDNIEVHHSSLGKDIRLDVEERLKRGEIKCVVSSTSLELGIDIGSVDLVCQIGSPKSVAKGLQRIGRSGHSMGKVAKGRLLVFDPDDLVECAVMCRAAHRSNIDRVGIPENCLDVLSQTIVGMSLDARWDVDKAFAVVRGSYCYRTLSKDKFISVLRYLGSKDEYEGVYSKIWYDEGENVFGRKKGSRMIYYMNLGTIPEEANYRVITNHGTTAGELSEKFVERLSPRDIFVLGGRSFEFVRSKGMTAYVKEATGRKPTVPSWAGEMLPRSFDLSMDVASFRREMSEALETEDEMHLRSRLSSEFDIDAGSARSIISYFKEQKAVAGIIPDDKLLLIEEYVDPSGNQRLIFHFPFGRRVNDALSRGYAYRISNLIGVNVSVTMSDDNFMIGTSRKIDISKIPGMLTSKDLESILRKAIKDSEIFKLRFRHTAARSFMILRSYMGRPISVNRQQVRSTYLLDALGEMENMPVIEETYREVLEDDMDIRNAQFVLNQIETGKMAIQTMAYNGTPSPFAHSVILSGFMDIVLMEDRSALLRELHRKVLYQAMGDNIKEFEFDEDQVVPYFREKIGRVTCKDDIVPLLTRTGPLQAIRERGRSIYPYCDADKRTVDSWVRELIGEKKIGTVFFDDPHIMTLEEIPFYAAATRKQRDLTTDDQRVLDCLGTLPIALSDISAKLDMSEDVTFRCMRKLESMYLSTRVAITGNNKWSFARYDGSFPDVRESADRIIMRFLECFAPATVQEIAYALSMEEGTVKASLESLIAEEEVVCGRFLISEADQYMKKIDRMRLRAGKSDVFDFDTVERYRYHKCPRFKTIREFFEYYDSAGSEIDVYNRVDDFDLNEWYRMRQSGEIMLGRFVRGRVRFVLSETGDKFASLRREPVLPEDEDLLRLIGSMGSATLRQLVSDTGRDKDALKESLMRLDKALRVVRAFDEKEDWGTENDYAVYEPKPVTEDPIPAFVKQIVRAYGPVPASAFRFILGIDADTATSIAKSQGAVTVLVGDGQSPMLVDAEEVQRIAMPQPEDDEVRVYSPFDPDLAAKWAEISSRYGDKWVYPLVMDSHLVGALEVWEMSGCIEVRSMDMDSPDLLPRVLKAIDRFMGFFRMKGTDIIRIREVLTKDAASLDEETKKVMEEAGYSFVNGFYAKGKYVPITYSKDQLLSYLFRKQHAVDGCRYSTVAEAVADRGYIRTDAEAFTRVTDRTALKKQLDHCSLVRTMLIPSYMGYTTLENASLYRTAKKWREPTDDMIAVLNVIKRRQSVSRKTLVSISPLSEEKTIAALNDLAHDSVIYQETGSRYIDSDYHIAPELKMDRKDAMKIVIGRLFREFGILTTEIISHMEYMRMSMIRQILAELEAEGAIKKGFFLEDDSTVMWMLAEDVGRPIAPLKDEMMLLNTQDNLHVYLRVFMRSEMGASENLIFRGTQIVGSFKGKMTVAGAKVEDFQGTPEAMRFLKETAMSLGVKVGSSRREEEDRDWDVSEFYAKMNPGAI
jgi:ATP-dependent Lhr-like helicase